MKGTLFSADFVFDSSNNARLLEINTDTTLVRSAIKDYLDFTDFGTVLSDSALDTLHIIYKPFHNHIVDKLTTFVNENVPNITQIDYQEEENCAVYLGVEEDADNKFILRMAYDESAILDSVYAKSEVELYSLFNTYNDLDSIPPAYHSSSAHGIINTISQSFNDPNLPDFVKKIENTRGATIQSIGLWKVGLPETGSDYRFNTFIEEQKQDDIVLTNFIPNLSGSYCTSVRSMQIVYGTNLDLCFLGEHKQTALFDIPTNLTTGSLQNDQKISHMVNTYHKFELTTNFPKGNQGVRKDSNIISSSGDLVNIYTDNTGSNFHYKSYFISGSPDTDDVTELNDWFHSGSTFPSGSYITSSNIVVRDNYDNVNCDLYKVELDNGDFFYLGGLCLVPTLDTGSNVIRWVTTNDIRVGNRVFDDNNTSHLVVSSSFQVSDTYGDFDTGHPNMEEVDTYIVKGTSDSLLVHNPYGAGRGAYYGGCFIAGTEVALDGGDYKNIEDIVVGDVVITYNEGTGKQEAKKVYETLSPIHDDIVTYTLADGSSITSTYDHPYYVESLELKSSNPDQTNELYNIDEEVSQIGLGDVLIKLDGTKSTITGINSGPLEDTQTYILRVEDNYNFYANNILVHNK
tara:strand:- start:105 stop:1991 length:1887 start_codon:yes stop_codon:yes gene_type:complete